MVDDWRKATAAELGDRIGAGEIDPLALTEEMLAAIDAHPLGARIYARTTPDRARAEARAAAGRARAGTRRGTLDGVPVSWKDLFDTAGTATEAGSALLAGRVPGRDAAVLGEATAAGLVCLGKTHMSELAFSGLGYNPVTAWPPARHDAEAVPGGSSAGAAASVAAGLAPAAVGSDTGGSVRLPAAWNDLVGLKTTHGLLPLDGVVPLVESLDTVGPLTRDVADAALMLAALGGAPRAPDLSGATLDGARLMVLTSLALDDLDPAVAAGFDAALGALDATGATLERRALPWLGEAMALSPVVFAAEAYAIWQDVIEADPDAMFPDILARFRGGRDMAAREHIRAWRALRRFRGEWAAATAGVDAVVLPTCPILPPKAAMLSQSDVYAERNARSLQNTRIANMMGLSALTLPTDTPAVGVSLFAAPHAEARLLRLGAAAEAALA